MGNHPDNFSWTWGVITDQPNIILKPGLGQNETKYHFKTGWKESILGQNETWYHFKPEGDLMSVFNVLVVFSPHSHTCIQVLLLSLWRGKTNKIKSSSASATPSPPPSKRWSYLAISPSPAGSSSHSRVDSPFPFAPPPPTARTMIIWLNSRYTKDFKMKQKKTLSLLLRGSFSWATSSPPRCFAFLSWASSSPWASWLSWSWW